MNIIDPGFVDLVMGAKSRVDLWRRILTTSEVRSMAELGVWKGEFAKKILKGCPGIKKYYMVDPWANLPDWNKPLNHMTKRFDKVYAEAMQNTAFAAKKIVVLRGRTKEVIDGIPDKSLDFAYIDGDHTLRGITIDLIRLLPKMKDNALIAGDDFSPNPWQHDVRYEPTLVCPFGVYFAEAMDFPVVALPFNQFVMQKTMAVPFSFTDPTGRYADLSLNRMYAEPKPAPKKKSGL